MDEKIAKGGSDSHHVESSSGINIAETEAVILQNGILSGEREPYGKAGT